MKKSSKHLKIPLLILGFLLLISPSTQACVTATTDGFPSTVQIYSQAKQFTNEELKDKKLLCYQKAISTEGVCANPENLHTYWNDSWKPTLEAQFTQLETDLTNLNLKSIKNSAVNLNTLIDAMFTSGFFGSDSNDDAKRAEFKQYVVKAAGSDTLNVEDIPDLAGKVKKCKESYLNFKENGICLRAAGDVSDYVVSNASGTVYKVRVNICDDLVRDCGTLYAYTSSAVSILKGLAEGAGLTTIGASLNIGNLGEPVFSVQDITDIEACASNLDNCLKTEADKVKICQYFSLIDANPDFEGDKTVLQKASTLITSMTSALTLYQQQQAGGGSLPRRRRTLSDFLRESMILGSSKRKLQAQGSSGYKGKIEVTASGADMKSTSFNANLVPEDNGDNNGDGNGGGNDVVSLSRIGGIGALIGFMLFYLL